MKQVNLLPTPAHDAKTLQRSALSTIQCEIDGLHRLLDYVQTQPLEEDFAHAVELIRGSRGRVVVTGMGKSGLVGRKLAATLASTGTPSFFLHPADASHGDLGMITLDDIVLALSWSGETSELSDIIDYCHRRCIALIAMTAGEGSSLVRRATVALRLPNVREACPNQLAPTASSIVQATLGDALAIALLEARGFSSRDFHAYHPRGRLGVRLIQVGTLMSAGHDVPRVSGDATIVEAMIEMSSKRLGVTAVVDEEQRLVGAFTDGDLRRTLAATTIESPVGQHMTPDPCTIGADRLASDALTMMNARSILQLFVCEGPRLVGIIHLHDILRAGIA